TVGNHSVDLAMPGAASDDGGALADLAQSLTGPANVSGRVIFDRYNGQPNIPARSRRICTVDGAITTITDPNGAYAPTPPANAGAPLGAMLGGESAVQRALRLPAGDAGIDFHVIDIDWYVGTVSRLGGDPRGFEYAELAVRFVGSTRGGYGARISAAHGGSFV